MTGLQLTNLSKSYGGHRVIHDASLTVHPGEFVVFVGPSGCGKSTLLRMIAGLEEITSGSLQIGGQVMNDVNPAERGVGMVFQSYALYPHMTVAQNMGFSLRVAGKPPAEIAARVAEVAQTLQLTPLLDRRPAALSGGQRQRVAIGRAILRRPKVFLFDEPLSNLDAELRVTMRIEIARLHRQLGATVVYVTHDQTEAMTLATRIVVLRAGRIEQVGAPLDLYHDPANTFVAGFIGSPRMNLIPAEVLGVSAAGLDLALTGLDARVTVPGRAAVGDRVTLGLRPEDFDPLGAAELTLEVDVVEHLGAESFAYARGGDLTLILSARGVPEVKPGQGCTARFDPARALLFDASGQRLRP
ncbi:ABC transporter ATP-binding protein [Rhodobacter sp. KR11]|uniref:ABC transporter ATP-binding protein n=1 Tax=Rhodobacter sp. KR11 TaxID=2974588 RepID=UPI0022227A4D|nr:ABC transporter ATP-binding protein [Rhodobacter sp. KR11]MCW1918131.1 ABC transporter ATP-binding protein [Rhodobacter sp. KR11]